MMVEKLAERSIAGLLKEQGRDMVRGGGNVGQIAVELNNLPALAKLVKRLDLDAMEFSLR